MDQPISPLNPTVSDAEATKLNVIRGLVVLSTELTILHINKPAADLARHLRRQENPSTNGHFLPRLWLEVGQHVREAMQREEAARGGRAVHVKRTISEGNRTFTLSGFGLVAGNDPQQSRIVLITEEHCPEHLAPTDVLRYRFLFTHIRGARDQTGDDAPERESCSD